jgi:hypothetical protein
MKLKRNAPDFMMPPSVAPHFGSPFLSYESGSSAVSSDISRKTGGTAGPDKCGKQCFALMSVPGGNEGSRAGQRGCEQLLLAHDRRSNFA